MVWVVEEQAGSKPRDSGYLERVCWPRMLAAAG